MAKQKHWHIVEMGHSLLFHSSIPLEYWVEAINTTIYLINRLPTPVLQGRSPFQVLFGKPLDYSFFRVFGCQCYPHLASYTSHKLQPRSTPCVFIGYIMQHKGYLCLDLIMGHTYVSRDVIFDELSFGFVDLAASSVVSLPRQSTAGLQLRPPPFTIYTGDSSLPCATTDDAPTILLPAAPSSLHVRSTVQPLDTMPTITTPTIADDNTAPLLLLASTSISTSSTHPMVTCSRDGTRRPKILLATKHPLPAYQCVLLTTRLPVVPSTYVQVVKLPEWLAVMSDEFNALLQNHTWTLVPHQEHQNIVGCKWIFQIKQKQDGSIDRYKAPLVAKGFHQKPSIDFSETSSPVVKPTTIRVVLTIAISHSWPIHQLDVKNAFLHGILSEEVYMKQPPGFVDHVFPSYVCHLHKEIYGLKQAPRAWLMRFCTILLAHVSL